jgi:hypothetical protein
MGYLVFFFIFFTGLRFLVLSACFFFVQFIWVIGGVWFGFFGCIFGSWLDWCVVFVNGMGWWCVVLWEGE